MKAVLEPARRFPIGTIRHVGVQLHRKASRGVTKAVLDDSRMLACFDHEGRGDVAETVERECRIEPGALDEDDLRTLGPGANVHHGSAAGPRGVASPAVSPDRTVRAASRSRSPIEMAWSIRTPSTSGSDRPPAPTIWPSR